jgi:predicted metallopeptidase
METSRRFNMTQVQGFARIFGIIYVVVGILGFVPGLVQPIVDTTGLAVETGYGRLLGLFPVNLIHNLVHIGVGIWGILAARSFMASVGFAKVNAILFGILAVLGIIPATNMLFGLAPLYGIDVVIHALTAAVAAYFGFASPARQETHAPTF